MSRPFYIHNFKQVLPSIKLSQADSLTHVAESHAATHGKESDQFKANYLRKVQKFGVKPGQIDFRYSETQKFNFEDQDIRAKTDFFQSRALEIFKSLYLKTSEPPGHIIHVTCTGYCSPSAAQILVLDHGWRMNTQVTHAYHMGCYASLPALRMAEGLAMSQSQSVDLVHTEMCTLHMDRHNHTPEQFVVQSLFADGHIKYSLSEKRSGPSFRLVKTKERLIPNSAIDMTWQPAALGMSMNLSREVPKKIGAEILDFLKQLSAEADLSLDQLLKNALFAVHPGGPKIIDQIAEILNLNDEQVQISRHVLAERGNMSSATLPHVWEQILLKKHEPGRFVISLAFGPGLTIFGAIFEII